MRKALLALVVFACALGLVPSALAAGGNAFDGIRFLKPGKQYTLDASPVAAAPARRAAPAIAAATPAIGTQKTWLGLDDAQGRYRLKTFTLRGIGDHIEVWVANDLSFPAGDCRNGTRTTITDEQVNYLIGQFDGNMYPKESAEFSVPAPQDGSGAILPGLVGLPADYYVGDADNIVTLIDNVRDDNYYDTNNSQGLSYIAGFFSGQLNDYFGRNVMTIDAFDWLHRTGATPPNEPVPGDNCASAPARPFLYEGVFAHEYQHLLESYEDPDETSWVNEGLSDSAIQLTGYGNPATPITDTGFDSHIQCFLGWLTQQTAANPNPRPTSGPENSLTLWGDQGDGEILCDYGAAYSFMLYLKGRFGDAFLTALHRNDSPGLVGLQEVLTEFGSHDSAQTIVHKWAAMLALDGVLDRSRVRLLGDDYRTPTLDATIDWDTPEAFQSPGAPPNGSDYVRLRDERGRYLPANKIKSLSFDGATQLEPQPIQWTVATDAPGREGDPVLAAPYDDNDDAAIVRSVTPAAGNANLTFLARWNTEQDWDYGFVQVSNDGGDTYRSIPCTDTSGSPDDPDIPAIPPIKSQLPGFTGDSAGFQPESCDLSAYAGQTVLLAFRFMSDPNTRGTDPEIAPGFWVDDVALGGASLSDGSTLTGWQSATQANPIEVSGFTVQIVAYDSRNRFPAVLLQLPLDRQFDASVELGHLRRLIPQPYDVVAAIVTYDEPTESISQPARYTLKVNGVTQPGG